MLAIDHMNQRLSACELSFMLNIQVRLLNDLYTEDALLNNAEHVLTQTLLWYCIGTEDHKDQDWQNIHHHQPSLLESVPAAFIARHGGLPGFCHVFYQWIQLVTAHPRHSQQKRQANSRRPVADIPKEPQVGVFESVPSECNAGELDARPRG